jgi:putative intracellular protease/amidase
MKLATLGIPLFLSLFALAIPHSAAAKGKHVLILVTGADKTLKGKQTGLWLEEYTVPYTLFTEAAFDVTVASLKGGKAPIDPGSIQEDSEKEWKDAITLLASTRPVDELSAKDFDAIFLPGGHGTMFDLPNNVQLERLLSEFEGKDKVIAAVCHGPAGFVGAKKADGTPLVAGKTITSFTDAEESAAGKVEDVPFLLESTLRKEGANFIVGENWASHVQVDGKLVTGQNPASSKAVAEAVIQLLQ